MPGPKKAGPKAGPAGATAPPADTARAIPPAAAGAAGAAPGPAAAAGAASTLEDWTVPPRTNWAEATEARRRMAAALGQREKG